MTRYNLSEENYKLMKNLDFSEMGDSLKFDDKTHSFETSDDEISQLSAWMNRRTTALNTDGRYILYMKKYYTANH